MITKREAKEIVDWVIQEINKRRFPYVTDGKLDLSKTSVGTVSGTQTSGGQIADGAIYDRHVHPNAAIQGTKIQLATEIVQGVVTLGTGGDAYVPTMSGLLSTVSGLGASLIGIYDGEGEFVSEDVESALHELVSMVNALTFLDLADTPNIYTALWSHKHWIPAINDAEAGLEFKPVHYIDGEGFSPNPYGGALVVYPDEVDGGTHTENEIIDAGGFTTTSGVTTQFTQLEDVPDSYAGSAGKSVVVNDTEDGLEFTTISGIASINSLTGEVTILGAGGINVTEDGQNIVVSGGDGASAFIDLTDVPSSYSGQGKKLVAVASAENALEFIKAFELASLTDDHDWTGVTCAGVAGEVLAFGETVYYSADTKWHKTDATTSGAIIGEVAIVVVSGGADADITLLLFGSVKDDSWTWSGGDALFFSTTSGTMANSAPSNAGELVRRAGYARSATVVSFRPDGTVVTRA